MKPGKDGGKDRKVRVPPGFSLTETLRDGENWVATATILTSGEAKVQRLPNQLSRNIYVKMKRDCGNIGEAKKVFDFAFIITWLKL